MSSLSELRSAIHQGRKDQIRFILDSRQCNDINSSDGGIFCLQLALNLNDVESFCLLIQHGASFDTLTHDGVRGPSIFTLDSTLDSEIDSKLVSLFDFALQLASSSLLSHLPQVVLAAPLRHAIREGDTHLMELILNKNSNVSNHIDAMGLTPLHHIAITHPSLVGREQNLIGMQLLLSHGAKIEKISRADLATPLHYACRQGKIEIVDLLLKESSDPSSLLLAQDSLGRTPTHLAIYEEHWELVNGLVESFKDMLESANYVVDYSGHTVAGLLFNTRMSSLPHEYQAIIPVLSLAEANWCLHDGVNQNDIALVDYALSQGADPNVFDFSHQSPLILASKLGHSSICSCLLDGGADHTLSDHSGMTPLHYASGNGHELIVKTLLEREEDPSHMIEAVSVNGTTPLLLALNNCHQEIATFLLSATSHNQKRESVYWMELLVEGAQLNDVSILKSIVDIYAPLKWAQELCNWRNWAKLESNYKPRKRNFLKICLPMESCPRLFLKDILKPKLAQKKLTDHQQALANGNSKQFVDDPICVKKDTKKPKCPPPFRLTPTWKLSSSPLTAMITSGNWNGLTFLIKEMKRANCFSKFLKSDPWGLSLIARALSNGQLSNEYKQDVLKVLKEVFPPPKDIPIGWALIHLLTVLLSPKPAIRETPLKTWPELLVSNYFSQYTTTVKYTEAISVNDAVKLTSALLTREEEISVFKPMPTLCSLVFMTVVNQVSVKLLRVLLEKGTHTVPTSLSLCNNTPHWCDTRNKCRRPRFALVEALTHGFNDHARLLLEMVGLEHMLPSPVQAASNAYDESDGDESENESEDEKEDLETQQEETKAYFFSSLIHGIHCLVSDGSFDLALSIIRKFPKANLNQFLSNPTCVNIWSLSLLSQNGELLAGFLLDLYLKLVSAYIRELRGKYNEVFDPNFSALRNEILPKILTHIIGRHNDSKLVKSNFHFDLFLALQPYFCFSLDFQLPYLLNLCGHGYTKLVKLVLKDHERDVAHKKDKHGFTPIYLAACGGHLDIVDYLLKEGGPLLDAQYYGPYHPLLGVLMYFNHVLSRRNGYRNCIRLELDHQGYFSPSLTCSSVFEDNLLAQKLVELVLPDSKQILIDPIVYLEAFTNLHQHDLRPFAKLVEMFPTLILSHLSTSDTEILIKKSQKMFVSDYALTIARHYDAHPSPDLSQKFLSDIVSFVSPSNPIMAAKLGYWEVIPLSVPSRGSRLIDGEVSSCKWAEILMAAVRKGQSGIVEYIIDQLKERENELDNCTLRKVMISLCMGGEKWLSLLINLLSLSLSDAIILDGLLAAVCNGNFTALDILFNHREVVLCDNIAIILMTAAKAGRKEIVMSLITHRRYVQCPSGINDTDLSFWLIVLEGATTGGKKDMAHVAIDKILPTYDKELMAWDGFLNIVNSCCWWGLDSVLRSLCIDDPNIFLTCINGCTPFESACGNGHFSTLTDLSCFPQLDSVKTIKHISYQAYSPFIEYDSCFPVLLNALNTGWWQETMKLSSFLQEDDSDSSLSPLTRDVSISDGFMTALTNNVQVVVEAHLNIWGRASGIILQAQWDSDIVKRAVLSTSPMLVETILRPLFDTKDDPPKHLITPESVVEAILQDDLTILGSLSKHTDIATIAMPLYGYNILHLLALYGRSIEVYEFIVSSISDDSLLTRKDHSNLTPCECALANGNYPIGAKLIGLMKKRNITLPSKVEELSCNARGWFPKLMQVNESSPKPNMELLPSKGTSLREAESLKDYCRTIQHVNGRVSDVLIEASIGQFTK